jgi:hypothetical protein
MKAEAFFVYWLLSGIFWVVLAWLIFRHVYFLICLMASQGVLRFEKRDNPLAQPSMLPAYIGGPRSINLVKHTWWPYGPVMFYEVFAEADSGSRKRMVSYVVSGRTLRNIANHTVAGAKHLDVKFVWALGTLTLKWQPWHVRYKSLLGCQLLLQGNCVQVGRFGGHPMVSIRDVLLIKVELGGMVEEFKHHNQALPALRLRLMGASQGGL